ncbi:NADPH:quinone oxidoreductase family protein [Hahella sp. CR1]|uniref:NADPH:quinone oxidoreductase family protein n=1 Tax=Hahella sp. CR1 TaxID=2992807 RepID=UPI002442F99F|nr:NADPH:quinone oxidoreductase family protein [Hahella sp. CR1]MDG9668113.1 NADPH:quinone oxidoreductase family protein [Hahella sp. CR1]
MRALLCKEHGPADTLVIEDTAEPKVSGANVLVDVRAAGLNFPDTLIIQGKYQFQPPMPFSPGGEVVGVVSAVGDKVKRLKPGDRVMGLTGWGGFAEKVAVPESNLIPVPAGVDDIVAAGFVMTYGTSMHALTQRGRLQAGETLLVLGAGGGVGLAAVEIGKAMGAKVIAAASSAEKLAAAQEAGADATINYAETDLKEAIKAMTEGRGVDVVYDPVGGALTDKALRSMAWGGRHLVVGFASGEIPKLPANLTLLKGCEVVGVFWGAFTQRQPQDNLQNFQRMFQWMQEGRLQPRVSKVYPFEQAAQAISDMAERRLVGKAVVRIAE